MLTNPSNFAYSTVNQNPIANFQIAPMPHIHFGWGIRQQLVKQLQDQLAANPDIKLVLITGKSIMQNGYFGEELLNTLQQNNPASCLHFVISGEPSPDTVDSIVSQCNSQTEMVIGLGGGSVLDAAKAVAGLIPSQTSVMDYLEGVGAGKPFGVDTCPFIAIPTTAGTGSETTKNAVLSRIGEFKKSFRDNKLLAKQAWLDPELLTTCPKPVLYSTGMDAFTQLLESYTTLKPNPVTDALALQGMSLFKGAFEAINSEDATQQQVGYSNLMLAASLSGTTLANAGLGAVHGLAGPIGAFFEAPHGLVCARLLAPITEENIAALQQFQSTHAAETLNKFKTIAGLFNISCTDNDFSELIKLLNDLAENYTPEGLSNYGLTNGNIKVVLENCRSGSMLGNSVELSDQQLQKALLKAL